MTSCENLTSAAIKRTFRKSQIGENDVKLFKPNKLAKSLQTFVNSCRNQRSVKKLAGNELAKTIPESMSNFLHIYVNQMNAISDLYESLDRLFICNNSLFGSNNEILAEVRKLSKSSINNINNLTNSVIEKLCNVSENSSPVSPTYHEPSKKKRKLESVNLCSETEVRFEESDDVDFAGSDIDLQLEEIADKISKSETVNAKSVVQKCNDSIFDTILDDGKRSNNLNYDSDGYVKVFIDGSCLSNGRSNAQAGIGVWFADNHPLNVSERAKGLPTNNNAEIQAATQAILNAKSIDVKKLRLYTDSQFVINCMTKWIHSWKRNNWINSSNKPVINKISLMELDKVIPLLDAVDWKYVEGHKGIIGNEKADFLAKNGARKL